MAASHKSKQRRKAKHPIVDPALKAHEKPIKQASTTIQPLEYDSMMPVWSFKRIVSEQKWGFVPQDLISHNNECLDPSCVLARLASFERMTWREIKQQQRGGSGKSCNHFIDKNLDKLDKYARNRLRKLQITENIFSLSLENKVRIYGILQSQVLEILWYDNEHKIYPMDD